MPVVSPSRLRAARTAAGLSREHVAIAIGRTDAAVESYERGLNVPPGNILLKLATVYGCTVEDLTEAEDAETAGAR